MYLEDTVVMITPERLDSWRIVPRSLILSYMVVFYQTCNWFMNLPDPNNAQAGFVSVVVGAGAAWFGLYVNGGKSRVEVSSKVEQRENI
jgi:hypothetical protein